MVKTVSVADYIVERLATEGINHCFGVAGDDVFPICDAVDSSAKVKWIGCANEFHQLTANDVGAMGRFGANVIVFVLNNGGYLVERALEENPNWTYNDLAPWNYTELPKALGCADWHTEHVTTLGELDAAMKAARASKTGAYIEIIGGKMDMPPALAFAHGHLKAMYGDTP